MTRTLSSAKPPFQLFPTQLDYRRAPMNIVCGKLRVAQRREQRAHLHLRKDIARLDRRLARDRGGKMLMTCCGTGNAVASQRVERLAQAELGVESTVRHRYGIHDQRASAKALDLESNALEIFAILLECIGFRGPEVKRYRKKQSLSGSAPRFQRLYELLVKHALVRRVLVDEHEPLWVLEGDVRPAELEERRNLGGRRRGRCGFAGIRHSLRGG